MRVIVLGAGLAGVAGAWYLRQAGHEVAVVERQPKPALETSFANGGQISVSHAEPWANPGAPGQIVRWLGREDAPLLFRPRADWRQWSWGLAFLAQCLPRSTRRNTEAIQRLAIDSRDRLRELRRATGIEYDFVGKGILHLFFGERDFQHAGKRKALLNEFGMRAEVLDARACMGVEPALRDCREPLAGGLYAPEDESGDAMKFTQRLAGLCAQRGVSFHHGLAAESLEAQAGRIAAVHVRGAGGMRERIAADAFVVALGSYAPQLVRPLGEHLPIYPVKGYSVTLPLAPDAQAPQVSLTDESRRIVCSRLGQRLRVAGTAELNGHDLSINRTRCEAILRRTCELFPSLKPAGEVEYWAGLRPATPSNVPIIGRGKPANLFYNTGHGTLGWTLACGSGQALADIVGGGRPALEFPFRGM